MGRDASVPNQQLQTSRLTLRWLDKSDRGIIFALRSDKRVICHTGIPQYASIDEADAYIQRVRKDWKNDQCLMWAIFLSAAMRPIGTICFWNFSLDKKTAEIGYDLLPNYWGQGYALEAIQAVLSYGFMQYGFDCVDAYPRSVNTASCRVLEKAMFRFIEERPMESYNGRFPSSVYKIAKGEYIPGPFFHGTRAILKVGDMLAPGYRSNFGGRKKANYVYLTATMDAAIWGAELAMGDGPGHIYRVEPTGPIEDDPNLTDKKFPGNPTKSYRTERPLRVAGEVLGWKGHSPDTLQKMLDSLEKFKRQGIEAIND
jgi:rifampin ADP-ribosylating transferase